MPGADDTILVVEHAGAVTLRREREGWARRELAHSASWPAWNPRQDLVVVSEVAPRGGALVSTLRVLDTGGDEVMVAYASPEGVTPVIAPGVPHYAQWSPHGDVLSYVAQGPSGLTFFVSEPTRGGDPEPIINGNPIFHSWCPDNNWIGVHAGTEFSMVEYEGSKTTARVTERGIGFRTPAFTDDAEFLAYVTPAPEGVAIVRALFQGTSGTAVRRFPAGVAMEFQPGSRRLAVAVAANDDSGAFDRLVLFDICDDDGPTTVVAEGPLVAFFWSPAGDRLATFLPSQLADGRYVVQIRFAEGALLAASEPFWPSDQFRLLLSFFDQYALSHPIWAPHGESLLVSGRLLTDSLPEGFGSAGNRVMRWSGKRGAGFEDIAAGDLGIHRPRQKPRV